MNLAGFTHLDLQRGGGRMAGVAGDFPSPILYADVWSAYVATKSRQDPGEGEAGRKNTAFRSSCTERTHFALCPFQTHLAEDVATVRIIRCRFFRVWDGH